MGSRLGRRLSCGLVLAGLLSGPGLLPAFAQDTEITLDTIDVSTRIRNAPRRGPASTVVTVPAAPGPGDVGPAVSAPETPMSSIGIIGASNSVITAREIEQSPAQTLPDILSQQTGIQIQHQIGGVNGSRDTVDLRGFGVFAQSNVLILVNGRRYQDFDLQGFDFSAIPLNSIERIEVTRGNSGTVVYGDGAIGGVINIVTKNGVGAPFAGRVEGLNGSFNYFEGRFSAGGSSGPWSSSIFGNIISSDGYRRNSALRQDNVVGNINYAKDGWGGYLNIAADKQHQGFPGALYNINPVFPYHLSEPTQSNTPLDWGDKQSVNLTGGVVIPVWTGGSLTLDGGGRRKFQQAQFYNYFNTPDFSFDVATAVPGNYVDTVTTTLSFTPRLETAHQLFGVPNRLLTGIDIYDTHYLSDRPMSPSTPPIHHYDIRQTTVAYYAMNKTSVQSNFDISLGGRVQSNQIIARDDYNAAVDPNAGFYSSNPQASPLNSQEWQYALHAGLEYRFNPVFAVFGRAARAFRLPNADERVGSGNPFGIAAPANFALKTQTSYDFEGGVRFDWGRLNVVSSVYDMYLNNEIHFIPTLFQDVNLDPTRRTGWELTAVYQMTNSLRLRGGVAYVRPIFREGPFAGNDIPMVSRWTGNAGLSWDVWKKFAMLDVTGRFWSERRMDNDQPNKQPLVPGNATVDVKLSGTYGTYDRFSWSAAVLNVFDRDYFDYAVASASTIGVFSAYPQPGRTYLVRAGANF